MSALPLLAMPIGLALLVWSADRFVAGAAGLARSLGMAPLLIGMLVVGFGTSAPEMLVSAIAALDGNPGLALGNAFGSNIFNIAVILGVTALVSPIAVASGVVRREIPLLIAATALAVLLLLDRTLSRADAILLLAAFAAIVVWSVLQARRPDHDPLAVEVEADRADPPMPPRLAIVWTVVGLAGLVASSRLLVWGAVETASALGVSDLVIGLTIVAAGTSLPELASSLVAVRRGQHDIALGNIIGSNIFNTLAVVGIAAAIAPIPVAGVVLARDVPAMVLVTLALLIACVARRGPGRINRVEGAALLLAYATYSAVLYRTATA